MTSVLLLMLTGCFADRASYPGAAEVDTSTSTTDEADAVLEALCATDEVTVRLRTGTWSRQPHDEDAAAPLTLGDHDEWYIKTSFETYNAHPIIELELDGYDVSTGALVCTQGEAPLVVQTYAEESCRRYYQVYCYLACPMDEALPAGDCDTSEDTLIGRALQLAIDLTDDDGAPAAATLTVTLGADPDNPDECPSDTCSP